MPEEIVSFQLVYFFDKFTLNTIRDKNGDKCDSIQNLTSFDIDENGMIVLTKVDVNLSTLIVNNEKNLRVYFDQFEACITNELPATVPVYSNKANKLTMKVSFMKNR